MLLGIKARAEGRLNNDPVPQALSAIGWIIASLCIACVLFARRRGWWWGLLPLAYAALIIVFTRDIWSAIAGFLWWGTIASGFLAFGGKWWKGLVLVTGIVVLIFVVAPQPQTAFGIMFLITTLAILTLKLKFIGRSSGPQE